MATGQSELVLGTWGYHRLLDFHISGDLYYIRKRTTHKRNEYTIGANVAEMAYAEFVGLGELEDEGDPEDLAESTMKPPEPTEVKVNPSLAEVAADPVFRTWEMFLPVGSARLARVTVALA